MSSTYRSATTNGTTKPIRIVNRAFKSSDAHGNDGSNAQALPPPPKSSEELFADLLSQAEGDILIAGELLADGVYNGNVEVGRTLGAYVEYAGSQALLRQPRIMTSIQERLHNGEGPGSRAAALAACHSLAGIGCKAVEPWLIDLMSHVLSANADKSSAIRTNALEAGEAMVHALHPHATRSLVRLLLETVEKSTKWQKKVASLKYLEARAKQCPAEVGHCLLDILTVVSEAAIDTRTEVAVAASSALLACCYTVGNRDFEKHIPAIVSCMSKPNEVADTVAKLSATTFVQAMDDASLAVLAPLMHRALHERSAKTQRRASVIITNFSKLVTDPADARPFLPVLIPDLSKVADEAADPELRGVAAGARDALQAIKEADEAAVKAAGGPAARFDAILQELERISRDALPTVELSNPSIALCIKYVASLVESLIATHTRGPRSWEACTKPYLVDAFDGSEDIACSVGSALRKWALTHMGDASIATEDAEHDDELCNCEFSLAYGGRILLSNATLKLRRGHRYGLCGANGVGKSTLMRAISNGQLEGFPPKDELRTVYVEHDIDASESGTPVVDFILEDANVQEVASLDRRDVIAALHAVGFTPALQESAVGSLSGGWKMKLALARAMLMKADILLLDEPTNHLDTTNVAWLEKYLTSMPDVSSMIVSHDSGFLDNVCTDIIHYENRKLKHYSGNLSEFVKVRPEAKAYYELGAAAFAFKFPEPGFLDGIKGKTQSVIRLNKVTFSYPGSQKKQLDNVSVRCSLGSRVAVLGRNGAGKSTLIKVMTGEMLPLEGNVWKHPNLRLAYVAQHAFHHIEQHLDETPSSYLWWRFGEGEDREARLKVTRRFTEEELAAREAAIERGERVVDYLNSRRMGKNKEFEYEVVWVGQGPDQNVWVDRSELLSEKWNLSKLVEEVDARVASYRLYRPLSKELVLQHLKDFGIEEEIAAHNTIRGLSGGQKVKLVLAAAMWNLPHLLVLDEPTNYLDRDSLGALASGIRDFGGGVVIISHNNEFTSALCKEEWHVADGQVKVVGGLRGLHGVASMASMASMASVSSLSSMGEVEQADGVGAASDGQEGAPALTPEEEEEAAAAFDAALAAKAARRAEKDKLAKEKAAKKAEKARLRYAKKF